MLENIMGISVTGNIHIFIAIDYKGTERAIIILPRLTLTQAPHATPQHSDSATLPTNDAELSPSPFGRGLG